MAKFCTYCGTQLEDGEVCNCAGAQAERQAAAQPQVTAQPQVEQPTAPKAPSTFGPDLKNTLLSYFAAPRKSVKALLDCKNSLGIAGVLVGVNFLAVFLYWLTNMAYRFKAAGGGLPMPVGPILLGSIVMTVVAFGLSAVVLFVVAKLSKHELSIQNSAVIVSASSIFPTLILVVCMILGLISMEVQSIVMQLLVIFWIVNAYADYREYAGLTASASIKNLCIFCIALFAIYVISYLIANGFNDWGYRSAVRSALGAFGDFGDLSDLSDLAGLFG